MTTHTLTDYRAIEQALRQTDLIQALYDAGKDVLMGHTLVTLHGSEHKDRRALEMRIFKRDFFKYFERELLPTLVEETLAPLRKNTSLDVIEFGYRLMIHLAIAFAGIDRQAKTNEETDVLLSLIQVFGNAATLGQLKADPGPVEREIEEHIEIFDKQFFTPSINRRQALIKQCDAGEISESDLPRDILTLLLKNEDRLELDRNILLRETAFFYLAGAHTSVHSLGHVIHHLLNWCKKHPEDRSLLEQDADRVQRFVYESFRLHPSSPIAKRRALAEMTLLNDEGEQENVEKDDIVIVDLRSANRTTEIFGDDATEFNPDREISGNIPFYGITFGHGMHACMGRNLVAGVIARKDKEIAPEDRQYGTLTLIAQQLLREGVQSHPTEQPRLNQKIERETWEYYPVVIGEQTP